MHITITSPLVLFMHMPSWRRKASWWQLQLRIWILLYMQQTLICTANTSWSICSCMTPCKRISRSVHLILHGLVCVVNNKPLLIALLPSKIMPVMHHMTKIGIEIVCVCHNRRHNACDLCVKLISYVYKNLAWANSPSQSRCVCAYCTSAGLSTTSCKNSMCPITIKTALHNNKVVTHWGTAWACCSGICFGH